MRETNLNQSPNDNYDHDSSCGYLAQHETVSQHVSKLRLFSMICMLLPRKQKSRMSIPEVLSTQKDAICEVAMFQHGNYRWSIQGCSEIT